MRVEPSEVSIVVAGDREAMTRLAPSSVIPYVRLKAPLSGESEVVEVSVELPVGVRLVKVEPKTVRLRRDSIEKGSGKGRKVR
jgi:hypothetical protein